MKKYFLAIFAAFFCSLILILILLPLLKKLKAGQYILGYVKEHAGKKGTPTMGGLAFITAIILICLIFCGTNQRVLNLTLTIAGAFAVVGFLDDFLKIHRKDNGGLKPYQKIIFQLAISLLAAIYCHYNGINYLYLPFCGGKTAYIGWGIIPLATITFIATVNCVNLTDGLDGLASGTVIAYLLAFATISLMQNNGFALPSFIGCGALAAFLIFNCNKASLFMGDTGSLALGGFISCLSVFSGNTLYIPLLGIMFVVSGISVIIQVIYYKKTRRRVFLMAPFHHHLQQTGKSEAKISFWYFAFTAVVGLICIIFA
ncbi:MAG: phospho-N-acetylmuramoyl-pentapeptide-transferase [Clostridia bacterium]|nr:phospho-N-acetylmuramoyl-pentapeptide-transferase [Clostridia bacterium]